MAQPDQGKTSAKHLNPECECRTISAPVEDIANIVKKGQIPILKIQTTGTDKLDLGAKAYDDGIKYVAIFDGDRHGIGSSEWNSITTCHLIRIAARMGKLYLEENRDEICLWLDTLCIPADLADSNLGTQIDLAEIREHAFAFLVENERVLRIDKKLGPAES